MNPTQKEAIMITDGRDIDTILERLTFEVIRWKCGASSAECAGERYKTAQALYNLLVEAMPPYRNGDVDPQTGAPVGMQGCVDHGWDSYRTHTLEVLNQLFNIDGRK